MSDSTEEMLLVRHEGPIAIMALNHPKRLNAFNWAMRQGMYHRLLEIEAMESCRAIVLTGAGGNLCAGGGISAMKHREIIEGRMRMDLATRIFKLLGGGPEPVLCALEGNAAAAGVSVLAAV